MPTIDPKEIERKVKEVLSKAVNIDVDKISLEQRLLEDLGVDSFASVELIFELEDMTGLAIPDADAINFKTVGDVISYIHSHISSDTTP